ncbi:MAG TPA: hypothetical protein PLJ34_05755 [Hyphomicrobiales bacterium]|nr:hypothetical protein [Kaistiaceae bacterium]HQF30933.1 hypothetical protein [Hyphomicrobiales bacterium]
MNALAITDISVFQNEPTVLDLRLAEVLGYERPAKIRDIIKRNEAELLRYGEVFSTVEKTSPHENGIFPTVGKNAPSGDGVGAAKAQTGRKRGRPGVEYHLNEAQALLICMKSDAPKAIEARHEVIMVFLAWRRGELGSVMPTSDPVVDLELIKAAPLAARVDALRVAARLYGRPRARLLWEVFGLPPVPVLPEPAENAEARAVLAAILDHRAEGNALVMPIRSWLAEAAIGLAEADDILARHGLRLYDLDGAEGFLVANSHHGVDHLVGAKWSQGKARDMLRTLPGARAGIKTMFGARQHRATWLPARYYEDEAVTVNPPLALRQ